MEPLLYELRVAVELRLPGLEPLLIELLLYPLDDVVPYDCDPADDAPEVTVGLLWLTGLLLTETPDPAVGFVAVLTDLPPRPRTADTPLEAFIASALDAEVTVLRTAVVLPAVGLELTEPDTLRGELVPVVPLLTLLLVPRPLRAVVVLPANTLSRPSVS